MTQKTQPLAANDANVSAAVTAPTASLEEVEAMTNDLKRLLVKYESTLEQEGLRHEIETLERWMESYRRGLSAAHKISEKGPGWLNDLRNKLKLTMDELLRLEGEGGNTLSQAQIKETEDMSRALQRIDLVVPNIEQLFSGAPAADEKPIPHVTRKAS